MRRVLVERGVEFDEIIVDDDEELANEIISISGQVTAPVIIWEDGRMEVGFEGERG